MVCRRSPESLVHAHVVGSVLLGSPGGSPCWDPRMSLTSQCPPTADSCRGWLQCGPHGTNDFPGPVRVSHRHLLLQPSPAAGHSTDLALVRSTPALAVPQGCYSTSSYKGLEQHSINCGFLTMDPQKAKLFWEA